MKRLLILLSSLALFGALTFGATVVRADHGADDNSQCTSTAPGTTQPGDDNGTDSRAIAADDNNGTEGDDNENGTSGDDNLSGQGGDDDLCGDAGDDHLQGGPGNDDLQGGPGDDDLEGQSGNDLLVGGKGHDVLRGGPGRDRIRARDGVRDHINCGSGVDTVRADRADVVARNCEHVSR
jgi:Ca2+-binding RTX toxin-like protein